MESNRINKLVAAIMAVGAAASVAHADGNDALLNKLVSKGILTQQEATELKKDTITPSATTTVVHGLGMPDWVTGLKFYGDFRGRFEEQTAESDEYHTRPRYRYRVRLGLAANMTDNFEIGFRAASGNPLSSPGVGGSPVTANQDMNSLNSRKPLWIDAAYAKWSPIKQDGGFNATAMIGKFDNPFLLSNMIWDYDIVPEGAGLTLSYDINKQHVIRAIGGVFVLDELNQSGANVSHDPYVFGGQVLVESKWTPCFETAFGGAIFDIEGRDSLRPGTANQVFYNSGNTRVGSGPDIGMPANHFNPIIATASATYKFDCVPLYPGKFPVKLSGEFMHNPGADEENEGWRAGITFGKASKKGTWEVNYRYQRLEADAWFDALVDDDNGAFYETGNPQLAGTGKVNGWFGGTNVKGHQVTASYALTDFMNLSFIYYLNDLIITQDKGESSAQHFMVDLNWKF